MTKIISIREPWASLIVLGHKDVENRTWMTKYRGPVLVHASQRADDVSVDDIAKRFGVRLRDDLMLGGIVGITEIVDCVRSHRASGVRCGPLRFRPRQPSTLPFVRWRGALSLREAPRDLLLALNLPDQKKAAAERPPHFADLLFAFRR